MVKTLSLVDNVKGRMDYEGLKIKEINEHEVKAVYSSNAYLFRDFENSDLVLCYKLKTIKKLFEGTVFEIETIDELFAVYQKRFVDNLASLSDITDELEDLDNQVKKLEL